MSVCVCVVIESYPERRAIDAVDEDEQSESSEDNSGQLKSAVCNINCINCQLTTGSLNVMTF